VSDSQARILLDEAARESDRLTRHLLIAAALRKVLHEDPIVVGGTAEEYWTSAEYHQTDLDLCAPINDLDQERLRALGFEPEGRHWVWGREGRWVAVEFPDSKIDGDEGRTSEVPVGHGTARVIGLEDLYLDRLRQATMNEHREGVEYASALAVAAARYEDIDWSYVRARISTVAANEGQVGAIMKRLDSRIRRRVRRRIMGSG
jgi:hypothetical protein